MPDTIAADNIEAEMRRIAEERLRPQLESLEGVAAVSIEGGLEEEIQVEVEVSRLDYLGISIRPTSPRSATRIIGSKEGSKRSKIG